MRSACARYRHGGQGAILELKQNMMRGPLFDEAGFNKYVASPWLSNIRHGVIIAQHRYFLINEPGQTYGNERAMPSSLLTPEMMMPAHGAIMCMNEAINRAASYGKTAPAQSMEAIGINAIW